MKNQYKPGDIAYIVESALVVREVQIHNISGSFYALRFTDTNGGSKVRESRLFPTKEAAEATLHCAKLRPFHPHLDEPKSIK